jgi:hypothetical protein
MSNAPFNASHLKYCYHATILADDRPLRPEIDQGLFHHGEVGETLSVINEVANQLGISSLPWCHFMEDMLRHQLQELERREDILCGLHELIAQQRFRECSGPQLHRQQKRHRYH